MSDEKLASAYRLAEPPSPHLTEETWEALLDGTLSASARDAAQEHVTRCDGCATVYRGLRTFERESLPLGAPGQAASRFRLRLWYWPASVAAFAAAAALFAFSIGPRRQADDQPALRGNPTAVVELAKATTEAGGVPIFSWAPVTTATVYRVGLFSEDGRPLWTRDVEAPPLRWPDDVPRIAGAYRWRVEALAAGALVARSHLADLEIPR